MPSVEWYIDRLETDINIFEKRLRNCDTNIIYTAGEIDKIIDKLMGKLHEDPVLRERFGQSTNKFEMMRKDFVKNCKCERK